MENGFKGYENRLFFHFRCCAEDHSRWHPESGKKQPIERRDSTEQRKWQWKEKISPIEMKPWRADIIRIVKPT
jgi:hypothetical protein